MNRMQFMAHVQFQQRVTDCRAAMTDAREVWSAGRLSCVAGTEQGDRVLVEWQDRHICLREHQQDKLWGLGLIAPGLPR